MERFNRTIKSAIRSYLTDHPKDWDLYTGALTFAYNCQPHSSTALAPFELILSRPPPPLALKSQPRIGRGPIETRDRWKTWLEKALTETKERLARAQVRYKRNYDQHLRKQTEVIKTDDYVFLRVERRDETMTRHKLAPLAEGPFKVVDVTGKTVVIERPDFSVERVSRDRVVLAPRPRTLPEIQNVIRPMTDEELIPEEYPVSEPVNLRDLTPQEAEHIPNQQTSTSGITEHSTRPFNERSEYLQDTTSSGNVDTQPNELVTRRTSNRRRTPNRRYSTQDNTADSNIDNDNTNGREPDIEEQEYVVDRIISHGINQDENHPSAKVGETTYRIRWYGYKPSDDTWEPIHHLPRNKVVSYYKRKKIRLPSNINEAILG